MGDLNERGEVGESVYGEKADIKLLFGDGTNGDFNAIIMMNPDGSRRPRGELVDAGWQIGHDAFFLFVPLRSTSDVRTQRRHEAYSRKLNSG